MSTNTWFLSTRKMSPRKEIKVQFTEGNCDSFIANKIVKGSTVDRISIEDFPDSTINHITRSKHDEIVDVLHTLSFAYKPHTAS